MLSLIFFIVFSDPFPVLYSPKFSPCPASFSVILIIFLALLFNSFPIFYVPFPGILFYLLLAFFLIFFTSHSFPAFRASLEIFSSLPWPEVFMITSTHLSLLKFTFSFKFFPILNIFERKMLPCGIPTCRNTIISLYSSIYNSGSVLGQSSFI